MLCHDIIFIIVTLISVVIAFDILTTHYKPTRGDISQVSALNVYKYN